MTSSINLKFAQHEGFVPVTVCKIKGDLDSSSYNDFQTTVLQEIEDGAHHILMDCSDLTYISSAGLRALYTIAKTLSAKKGNQMGSFKSPYLKLFNPTATVYAAFEVMGLNMSLEIHDDFDKAIASFVSGEASGHDEEPDAAGLSSILTEELKETLRGTGLEVEAKRLELLRGRRFLIVMGGYPGKRMMYERARELGVSLVVVDGPGHWAQKAVDEGLFEAFIEVDLYPADTLAERAYTAIKATGLHFDGVANFEDSAGPLTALLANVLGLPGHHQLSVGYSKNKVFTREVCLEAGIPSPKFFRFKSAEDLEAAAAHVGFPAVLKPISGMDSFATYLVKDMDTLRERYNQTITGAKEHLRTSGVHSDDLSELIWSRGFDMTLEEFLDGEEFDVEVVLSEGQIMYASVLRDLPQPYMKETGSQMPPDFPQEKQDEMIAFTEQVLRALEFVNGSFHVEVKYTSNGPRLIEVNARIGGGPIYEMHKKVWGVDLVEQYLLACLGIPIRPQKAVQPLTCIITSDLLCENSGTVSNVDFLKPILNHPNVMKTKVSVEVGQQVIGPDKGVPDPLGDIRVQAPTVEEASRIMDEILKQIENPVVQDA